MYLLSLILSFTMHSVHCTLYGEQCSVHYSKKKMLTCSKIRKESWFFETRKWKVEIFLLKDVSEAQKKYWNNWQFSVVFAKWSYFKIWEQSLKFTPYPFPSYPLFLSFNFPWTTLEPLYPFSSLAIILCNIVQSFI